MNMTYLHHSGFQIETKRSVLLFDYYTQNGMFDRVNEGDFPHKKFYIFVTHGHGDHYDPAILRWADRAHYILSDDVELPKDFKGEVTWVKPHQKLTVDDLEIETLASNDQGVSFVVKVAGKRTVFHAGDLNWWHWNGESDEFNNDIADSYRREIDLLKGREIDVACVPADPRLQDKYDWAVDYFMENIGAKVLLPMHFWKHFDICEKLRQKPYGAHVALIRREGDTFII